MKHSTRIGGSSVLRRLHCPGSMREEDRVGSDDSYSPEAEAGHRDHDDAEKLLLDPDRESNNDMAKEAVAQFHRMVEYVDDVEFLTEQRVDLSHIVPQAWGHLDLAWAGWRDGKRVGGVVDWKFGHGIEVQARGNYQLGFYALGALRSQDPDLQAMFSDVGAMELAIIQPTRHDDPDIWVTGLEWFDMFEHFLVAGNARLDDPDASLKMGPWCRFCKAKLTCGMQTELADEILTREPKKMTSVELAWALKNIPQLEQRIVELKRLGMQEAEQGVALPGMKVVEKKARRSWTDEDAVRELARKKKIAFEHRKMRSPNQLEMEARKKLGRDKAKPVIQQLRALQDKQSSGHVLVPDSDKRPAVQIDLQKRAAATNLEPMDVGCIAALAARKDENDDE